MTYFPDLGSQSMLMSASFVRAVGWLSRHHPYSQGHVSDAPKARLNDYCRRWGLSCEALWWPVCAGVHRCEFCLQFMAAGHFGVPAQDVLYVCPEMIGHYVEAHGYLPPREFLDALLVAPVPGTEEYAAAVASFREHN